MKPIIGQLEKLSLRSLFSNEKGVSIIQVLIAASMVSVVSLGVMEAFKQSTKTAKRAAVEQTTNQMLYELESFFRDSKICRATLFNKSPIGDNGTDISEVIKINGIEDLKSYEGDSADIEPAEVTTYNSLLADINKKKILLKTDCNITGDATATNPCTLGQGTSGRILIYDMKIRCFEKNDGGCPPTPKSPTGSSQALLTFKVVRGATIGKDPTGSSSSGLFGSKEVMKKIPIIVSMDSNNKISSCVTELKNYYDEACNDLLQGDVDASGDLKCKNIKIDSKSGAFSITAKGHTKVRGVHKVRKFVDVDSGTAITEGSTIDGSLRADGEGIFKKDFSIFNGALLLGDFGTEFVQIDDEGDHTIKISGIGGNIGLGYLELGDSLKLTGSSKFLGIQNTALPAFHLDVTGTGYFSNELTVDQDIIVDRDVIFNLPTEKARMRIQSGFLEFTGGIVQINGGHNDGSYSATEAGDGDKVATQDWVVQLFDGRLGNQATGKVIDHILEYSSYDAIRSLKRTVCENISPSGVRQWAGTKCNTFYKSGCSGDQALYGISNGSKLCTNIIPSNSECSNSNYPIGVTSGGSMNCASISGSLGPIIYSNLN